RCHVGARRRCPSRRAGPVLWPSRDRTGAASVGCRQKWCSVTAPQARLGRAEVNVVAAPENILLHRAEDHEAQARETFAGLEQRGLPTQHQTPHITITFAPRMEEPVVDQAEELLAPLMPATLQRMGTVVFGTRRKQTVAWLLEASDELETAARAISTANPEGRGPRWIPHLTMGLRLPRAIVPDYIRALDELSPPELRQLTAAEAGLRVPSTDQFFRF